MHLESRGKSSNLKQCELVVRLSVSKGLALPAHFKLRMTCPSLFALALSVLIGTAADGGSL